MSSETRYKRPPLDRSDPIRSWSGVFGARPRASDPAASHGAHTPQSSGSAWTPWTRWTHWTPGTPGAAGPSIGAANGGQARDPITGGVEAGYRVIEQYLRQGQAFARSFDRSGPNGDAPQAAAPNPQHLAELVARSMLDLTATWFDYVQAMSGPLAGSRPRSEPVGPFDIEARKPTSTHGHPTQPSPVREQAEPEAAATPVSLQIVAKQRTEITLDLKPRDPARPLSAHDLRATDPGLPRIGGVSITWRADEARLLVGIEIPEGQPAGTYSGLIVDDESGLPRGSLAVRVVAAERD